MVMNLEKVFLFDMDGIITVGESTDSHVYRKGSQKAVEELNPEGIGPHHIEVLKTSSSIPLLKKVCEKVGISIQDFWYHREQFSSELENELIEDGEREIYNDTEAIIDISSKYQTGIVSNNREKTAQFINDQFFENEFDTVVARYPTLRDYKRRKPRPDFLIRAMRRLELTEETDVYYIGDKESDIIAGNRANVKTVLVERPHNHGLNPGNEPDYTFESLHEVRDVLADQE